MLCTSHCVYVSTIPKDEQKTPECLTAKKEELEKGGVRKRRCQKKGVLEKGG